MHGLCPRALQPAKLHLQQSANALFFKKTYSEPKMMEDLCVSAVVLKCIAQLIPSPAAGLYPGVLFVSLFAKQTEGVA